MADPLTPAAPSSNSTAAVTERMAARERIRADFREIGTTGLLAFSGIVQEEFLPQLRGRRGLKVYREMADNDAIAGAVLFAIDMVLRQVEWRMEPNKEAHRREKAARKLIEQQRQGPEIDPLTGEPKEDDPFTSDRAEDGTIADAPPGGKPPPFGKPAAGAEKKKPPFFKAINPFSKKPPIPQDVENTDTGPKMLETVTDPAAISQLENETDDAFPRRRQVKPEVPLPERDLDDVPAFEDLPPDEDLFPGKTEAELVAEFVDSCREDMSSTWEELISSINLPMLRDGYAPREIVYKRREGHHPDEPWIHSKYDDHKIGWRKIPGRAPETISKWHFDESDGMPKGFYQQAPPHYKEEYIPLVKGLLFRTLSDKANPEGRSIFRSAYRPWYFKKRFEELEGTGAERDLAGIPIMWVPPSLLSKDATDDEKALAEELKKVLINVKRNEQEGLMLPLVYDEDNNKAFEFELLTSQGRRQFDLDKIIARYNLNIAMCVLADFILLGHQNVGSNAMAMTKTDVFQFAVEAWIRNIADVFNKYAIPRLLDVNGIDPRLCPKLSYGKVARIPLADIGAYIVQLAQASQAGYLDPELKAHLHRIAGLPVSGDGLGEDEEEEKDEGPSPEEMAMKLMEQGGLPGQPGVGSEQPPGQPGAKKMPTSYTPGAAPAPPNATRLPALQSQAGKSRGKYTGESGRKS